MSNGRRYDGNVVTNVYTTNLKITLITLSFIINLKDKERRQIS